MIGFLLSRIDFHLSVYCHLSETDSPPAIVRVINKK